MEISEFKNKYNRVLEVINEGRYERALSMLRRLVEWNNMSPDLLKEVNNLQAKYFYMLRYMLDNPAASDMGKELKAIAKAVSGLAGEIERQYHSLQDNSEFYARVRYAKMRPEETLEGLFADYLYESARLAKDASVLMDTRKRSRLEQISDSIFGLIWTDINMEPDTQNTILALVTDSDLPVYDRSLWTAAVGLGLFGQWNEDRYALLEKIMSHAQGEISDVAFIWLGLTLLTYSANEEYNEVILPFCLKLDSAQYTRFYRLAVLLARQLGAPRLSARFSTTELSGLTGIGRSFSKDVNDNKDPMEAVEKAMSELPEGSFDKIKDFTEAVQKGYDVFYGTLGKMRNYDFFRRSSNWLLPFHADHSSLAPVVDSEGLAIAGMMEKMHALADSDKYSMLLSIAQAPENVRSNMLQSMTAPISAMMDNPEMEEMYREEGSPSQDAFISVYLKNLYRFWTLGPGKQLPMNPFYMDDEVYPMDTVCPFCIFYQIEDADKSLPDNWLDLPVALAESGYPASAGEFIYSVMHENKGPYHGEYKLAGSFYIAAGDNDRAADCLRAHLSEDRDDFDSALVLAGLELDTIFFEDAVMILERFSDKYRSDNRFLEMMGRLQIKNFEYEEALELLQQLEYQLPENGMSAEAEMAMISALSALGSRTAALERLDNLELRTGATALTLIHRGVILWEEGKRRDALECFERAFSLNTFSEKDFFEKVRELYSHVRANKSPDRLSAVLPSMLEFRKGNTQFGKL